MNEISQQFDLSELNEDIAGIQIDPARQSGLHHLSQEDLQAYAKEHARIQKLTGDLLDATMELVEALPNIWNAGELYNLLHAYYQKAGFIMAEGKVPPTSNVMKLHSGLWQEFETILTPRTYPTEQERLKSQKMTNLKRVLTDFCGALLQARNESNWESVEDGVYDVLNLILAPDEDLFEKEFAFAVATTRQQLLSTYNSLEAASHDGAKVKAEKLDLFAEGRKSVGQFRIEKERYDKLQKCMRVLKKLFNGKPS